MSHTSPEVADTSVSLLRKSEIRLRNQYVAHAEHTKTTKLLGTEEQNRWEPARHLRVESHLYPSLNLILHLD